MDILYNTFRWAVSGLYGDDHPNINTQPVNPIVGRENLLHRPQPLEPLPAAEEVTPRAHSDVIPPILDLGRAQPFVSPSSPNIEVPKEPDAPSMRTGVEEESLRRVVDIVQPIVNGQNQNSLHAPRNNAVLGIEGVPEEPEEPDALDVSDDEFDLVPRPEENRSSASAPLDTRWARMHRYFFDPANPEKKKKYLYAIHATRQGLTRDFPQWETELLPALQGELHSNRNDEFVSHAYQALLATSQLADEGDIKTRYTCIFKHLRDALTIPPTEADSPIVRQTRALLLHLCYLKFTGVHMYPFLEDFVGKALRAPQEFLGKYEIPGLTFETVADAIDEANRRLRTTPPIYLQRGSAKDFKKTKGTLGVLQFDPTGVDSNTPWVHSVQTVMTPQGEKEILILRHGTPTRDIDAVGAAANGLRKYVLPQFLGNYLPNAPSAEVVPEFVGYLNAHPEKQILYVNLQAYDHRDQHEGPGEYARSKAIRGLENGHENFHFLALPLDGTLWKTRTLNPLNTAGLIARLQRALLNQEDGFGLPQKLVGPLGEDIPLLLDKVHDLYFNRQDLHTIEEKKVFIMLFYSELKEYVKNKLNIDLMTSACKDNKDRGNASTIVDMAKNLLKLDRIDDPQALRELFFSALAPFIIKNEEIIEERLELALNVIRHLATLPEPQKQKIQQANEASAFKILGQRIPKEEVSPSQMMGPENFLALLNHLRKIQEQRTVEDPSFEATVRENGWNREQLEQQIRYNLPRMDLRVNGQRITQYEQLRDIPDSLLAFLHLGAAHHTMKDPAHYLNGNALGMTVALPAPSEDRTAVQDLISLCHSEGKKAAWRQMPLELSPDFEAYLSEAVDQGLLPSSFRRAAVPQGQPIYPTRIDLILIDGAYDLQIEQDLVFGEYPMVAKAHLKTGNLAQVSWHFVTV